MSALALNAEALYSELLRGVQALVGPHTRLVGITSGGAWLAERLQKDLALAGQHGTISSAMHRDDFAQRGLSAGGQTSLPFGIQGADLVILDDVLYTGRTLRAVINELFDYGRSAIVKLAVLLTKFLNSYKGIYLECIGFERGSVVQRIGAGCTSLGWPSFPAGWYHVWRRLVG